MGRYEYLRIEAFAKKRGLIVYVINTVFKNSLFFIFTDKF